jgi:enamine deaminase RidA (YjgF/YER057c/UK114 family)
MSDANWQALIGCAKILRAASAQLEDVVEMRALLLGPADFAGLNDQ